MQNATFTELDFAQNKEGLKQFLKAQAQFKDYDFDGANINVLLDLLAYNTFHNNMYQNMMFSEMFMDSVQLRENAVSHAKELNYLPGSRLSARSTIDVSLNVPDPSTGPSIVTIPKGTKFNAQCGRSTFTFITDENRSVRRVSNAYRISDLAIYEGRLVREMYQVDSTIPQNFTLSNEYVDVRSVRVFVRETSNPNSTRVEYMRATDIFGVDADDTVFYIEPYFDNLYKITFGNDKFGANPLNGSVIEIEYRVSDGDSSNGASNFTPTNTIAGYTATVNSSTPASNGAERESIEDIKFFAPKSIQIQERAVTKTDYEILLKQRFPNIQAISVYGGDEVFPPQYGKVIISVDSLGVDGAGIAEIQEYRNFLQNKTPLTIEPVFISAEFMGVELFIDVEYVPSDTALSSDELSQVVLDGVSLYNDTYLNKFNVVLRQSRLANIVDVLDPSFLSTTIVSYPIIDYSPVIGQSTNPTFNFGSALKQSYPLDEDVGFRSFIPAVSTSKLTLQGVSVTLQDDGNGNIIAVTADTLVKEIFRKNIGTVEYSTGQIRLTNITIDDFDGTNIRVRGNTVSNDVKATKNKILSIQSSDITVNMIASR